MFVPINSSATMNSVPQCGQSINELILFFPPLGIVCSVLVVTLVWITHINIQVGLSLWQLVVMFFCVASVTIYVYTFIQVL